jgi:hypothetical protein
MALQGVKLVFSGKAPSPRDVVREAERIGGLKIVIVESNETKTVAAFASFPEGLVSITSIKPSCIFITDLSLIAPAMYRLLWETSVLLGGQPEYPETGLVLPLTEAHVRDYNRKYNRSGIFLMLSLFAFFAAILAIITGMGWFIWNHVARA